MTNKNNTWQFPCSYGIAQVFLTSVEKAWGKVLSMWIQSKKKKVPTRFNSLNIFLVCDVTGNCIALSASQWVSVLVKVIKIPRKLKGRLSCGGDMEDGASASTAGRSPGCHITAILAPRVASENRPALGEAGLGQRRLVTPEFVL